MALTEEAAKISGIPQWMPTGNPQKRFCSHEMLRLTAEGYDARTFAQISISLF